LLNPIYASTTYLAGTGTDVVAAIAGLAPLGLDGIEIGSTHAARKTDRLAADIRRLWSGELIVHNYFPAAEQELVVNLASADDDLRMASLAHASRCLATTADLGASVYTVHPGFVADVVRPSQPQDGNYDFKFSDTRASRTDAFGRMLTSLEKLAGDADRFDVMLAVETEGSITTKDVLLLETPDEYDALFAALGNGVKLNFNLAHSAFAARRHKFDLAAFIAQYGGRFAACELSHNDGERDQHLAIPADSWVLDWLPRLPEDVPLILEFRDATTDAVRHSMELARAR
jgi:sugar phosphate isomerase/epimerase